MVEGLFKRLFKAVFKGSYPFCLRKSIEKVGEVMFLKASFFNGLFFMGSHPFPKKEL